MGRDRMNSRVNNSAPQSAQQRFFARRARAALPKLIRYARSLGRADADIAWGFGLTEADLRRIAGGRD
jgi:hypothetical protein